MEITFSPLEKYLCQLVHFHGKITGFTCVTFAPKIQYQNWVCKSRDCFPSMELWPLDQLAFMNADCTMLKLVPMTNVPLVPFGTGVLQYRIGQCHNCGHVYYAIARKQYQFTK